MLHNDGNINDEELLTSMYHRTLHVDPTYSSYDRFDIFGMQEDGWGVELRVRKEDIFRLAAALQLPKIFKCQNMELYQCQNSVFKFGMQKCNPQCRKSICESRNVNS